MDEWEEGKQTFVGLDFEQDSSHEAELDYIGIFLDMRNFIPNCHEIASLH